MGKYGVGRNGYPSGRTGAADRDFYVQAGRAAKERREAEQQAQQRASSRSASDSSESKGFFSKLFGW